MWRILTVDLSGYLLDPLREDGEFILYRARSPQPELPSILLLIPSSSRPSAEILEKIDHEYSLKSDLDTTWALRPLEISSFNHKRVLVLEDPGGMPLNRVVEGPMVGLYAFQWAVGERKRGHKIFSESTTGERKVLVLPRLERVARKLRCRM